MPDPTVVIDPATADTVIAGRRLGDYQPIREFPGHHHNHPSDLVGYVVRETIRDGQILWHGEHIIRNGIGTWTECGVDVAAVDGAFRYSDTWPIRDRYRTQPGGYAVVDHLYQCGCRS